MRSRVELFESIRRDSRLAGMGIRALARKHRVHRRTVRQALSSAVPPERKQLERPSPVLDAWKPLIAAWVTADERLPKKQRHTGRRIWQRLVAEHGAALGESTVRKYVARLRRELGGVACVSVPQVHHPGAEAEVDFAELWVWLEGTLTKLWLFTMRLSCSGRAFHRAFATQAQEAFFEGHVLGFAHFGGLPRRVRYDNLKPAVERILQGRNRIENERFITLRSHYGFTKMPFRRDLPVGALHRHRGHAEHALGVLTGEVGAGKTAAVRAALDGLDPSRHTLIYLGNPTVGARGIHHAIVTALGGMPRFHYAALIPQAAEALGAETGERGRQVILVVDEAHLLDPDQLEGIRLLTNADMDSASPLACLLVGQPTLRRRIKLGAFAALDQRIALRYAMPGMEAAETKTYLAHHLALAGHSDTLFSDDAVALIHHTARGLPRAVNNLAIQALIATYATNKSIVDESSARAAIAEVTTD